MNAHWDEIRRYVGFDDDDTARLAALWPMAEPETERIVDGFYERALANESTRRVLTDEATVQRLKLTLRRWLSDLLCGPHDHRYAERHARIGQRHLDVGLEHGFMIAAMDGVMADLEAIARRLPPDEVWPTVRSLHRLASLELAAVTTSYVASRERRTALALQDLLVQNLYATVLLVDDDGRISAATRQCDRTLGSSPQIGQPWEEAIPRPLQEASRLRALVDEALTTGREAIAARVDLPGELPRSFRVVVVPVSHALARLMIQIEELTEAVALEGRMRRAEALAQLGAMSAAVAHELRNPLAGISGAIQVIANTLAPDAPHKPIMDKVGAEIRRLDRLVSDLLAFSRPGAARLQPVELLSPAQRAVGLLASDAPGIGFAVVGSGYAQADPELVYQIVLNLLLNAIDATDGHGTVEIHVSDGEIVVSDDGPGIDPALRTRIFEPFFTTKTRGTGLGLAICQRFAAAMGGRMSLREHGPLSGATFALTLDVLRLSG